MSTAITTTTNADNKALRLSQKIIDLLKQVSSKPSQERSEQELSLVQYEMLSWIYSRHTDSTQSVQFAKLEVGMLNWIMHSSFPLEKDPPDIRTVIDKDVLAVMDVSKKEGIPVKLFSRDIEKPVSPRGSLANIVVVQLLREQVGVEFNVTDKIVTDKVKGLREIVRETHNWMMETMIEEKHAPSLIDALSTNWNSIPSTIKDYACVELEVKCNSTLFLPIGRCKEYWLSKDLLHKRTNKKKINLKKISKYLQLIYGRTKMQKLNTGF